MATYLIVGQGSMGKRRVRCLLANQIAVEQISIFDTRDDRLAESVDAFGVTPFNDIAHALDQPDLEAVFISVPGFLHIEYALLAAQAGKHWFCEIPLSTSMEGIGDLQAVTEEKGLVGAIGCQPLFHPLYEKLTVWADTNPILSVSQYFGSYLPEWHPYEDYRKFYASDQSKGGGNLDVIAQEFTWQCCLMPDKIKEMQFKSSHVGNLELVGETPDHHEIILEWENGVMSSHHFDLLNRAHEGEVRFVSEGGVAKLNVGEKTLKIFANGQWDTTTLGEDFDYESCYISEIAHFLKCIRENKPWVVSLAQAQQVVQLLIQLRGETA